MRSTELTGIDDARKDPRNAPPTDAMREAFEAALADYYERLELNYTPDFTGMLVETRFGEHFTYCDPYINAALMGFEASRAQPIVLPASLWHDGKEEYVITRDAAVAAITAQGYAAKESE